MAGQTGPAEPHRVIGDDQLVGSPSRDEPALDGHAVDHLEVDILAVELLLRRRMLDRRTELPAERIGHLLQDLFLVGGDRRGPCRTRHERHS
jgi:hypothetical protein